MSPSVAKITFNVAEYTLCSQIEIWLNCFSSSPCRHPNGQAYLMKQYSGCRLFLCNMTRLLMVVRSWKHWFQSNPNTGTLPVYQIGPMGGDLALV